MMDAKEIARIARNMRDEAAKVDVNGDFDIILLARHRASGACSMAHAPVPMSEAAALLEDAFLHLATGAVRIVPTGLRGVSSPDGAQETRTEDDGDVDG
jgi:hypothetical protein